MKIENCKNIKTSGTVSVEPFGTMPLYEMKSDPIEKLRYAEGTRTCHFSESCFTCPRPDCGVCLSPATVNVLPNERELLRSEGR